MRRSITLNFRVNSDENRQIRECIADSGKMRKVFFSDRCLHQRIIFHGSISSINRFKPLTEVLTERLLNMKRDNIDDQRQEIISEISELADRLNLFAGRTVANDETIH